MNVSAGNLGGNSITIQNFILVQTGTYQEQYIRPFNMHVHKDAIDRLEVATRGGMNLGVASVQEIASDVIVPQAQVEGQINIEQGWRSRRFRFLMKVKESHKFIANQTIQRVFFGYTDQCDASMNHLDPNMRIYFNSETIIKTKAVQTIHGIQEQAEVFSSNQIVSPVDMVGGHNGMFARATAHLIRPEDMFSIGQTKVVAQRLQESNLFDGVIDRAIDHRTMVGEGGAYKYSNRRDTSPTRYLSNSLSAWQHAVKEANMSSSENDLFGNATSNEVMLGEAASACGNHNIHSNSFLAILKEQAGYMERGYITLAELTNLFPEVANSLVTQFAMDNGRSMRKVSSAEDSQSWTGADYTTIGASLLSQTVPSIMMDNMFRTVSFAVTNGSGPNQYIFEFHGQNSKSLLDNIDMRQNICDLERRLAVDVLHNITRGNQLPFRISMFSDLAGDSIIDIAIGSNTVERFVAPTFSDSLFSPIITRNDQLPSSLSSDLTWLVGEVIPGGNKQVLQSVGYNHPVAPTVTYNPINQQTNNGISNGYDLGLL